MNYFHTLNNVLNNDLYKNLSDVIEHNNFPWYWKDFTISKDKNDSLSGTYLNLTGHRINDGGLYIFRRCRKNDVCIKKT